MARITFLPCPSGESTTVEADNAAGRTLLAVAEDHRVPILFNCKASACGACLVEITGVSGAADLSAPPGEEEAILLQAMGKRLAGSDASSATFRLACQYIVPDADIVVRYPNALGSG
jgi:ferredoxin